MTEVKFKRRKDEHYGMTFSYDPAVVDAIKFVVPGGGRSWNPEIKEWRISDFYIDDLIWYLKKHDHQVTMANLDAPAGGGNWAQVLLERVGPDRAQVVFRALSKVLHPDNPRTGDETLQKELVTALEKYLKH